MLFSMNKPHIIVPTAVYDLEAARSALGLTRTTLNRELRLGRLRASKRAGKYLLLGQWLVEWIEGGEVRRNGRSKVSGAAEVEVKNS